MKKKQEFPVVEVRWLDAADVKDADLDTIMERSTINLGVVRDAVGYLVKQDEFGVALAYDIDQYNGCELSYIPRGLILRMRRRR